MKHIIYPELSDGDWNKPKVNGNLDHLGSEAREIVELLARNNIVVIPGDVCCRTCGAAAIDDACNRLEEEGEEVVGAVWFSEQDDWNYPMLYYDQHGDEITQQEFGEFIVQLLEENHYPYEWNGDASQRIEL